MADISMGLLGGKLKVKEKLTGRFADILSWMYIGMATLRRFEAEGRRKEDLPFLHYSMKHCFIKIQESFDGIFANFDTPVVGWVFRWPIRLWSRLNKINAYISDDLTHEICRIIQTGSEQRDRITSGVYLPDDPTQAMGRMEKAFKLVQESEAIAKKIKKAVRKKELPKQPMSKLIELALEKSIITAEEKAKIAEAEEIRYDAIQVDDFSEAEFVSRT